MAGTAVCTILLPALIGRPLATLGVVIVAASFGSRGHALAEPRLLLASLIILHILDLAFWIGAFVPLYRLNREKTANVGGHVAQEFGQLATWVVGALTLAGGGAPWLLTGNMLNAIIMPYGQFFAIKLGVFLAIMSLAARKGLRPRPALLHQEQGAGARLRGSVRKERHLLH